MHIAASMLIQNENDLCNYFKTKIENIKGKCTKQWQSLTNLSFHVPHDQAKGPVIDTTLKRF